MKFLLVFFPVSFATVHIQVCTSGKNKLRGPESKPAKQLGQFSLVKKCYSTIGVAMKYCNGRMSIRDKMEFNFDRLRHAQTIGCCFYVACLYSKQWQKTTTFSIDKRFHFVPKQWCIFLTELPAAERCMVCFCKDKHDVLLKCCVFNT